MLVFFKSLQTDVRLGSGPRLVNQTEGDLLCLSCKGSGYLTVALGRAHWAYFHLWTSESPYFNLALIFPSMFSWLDLLHSTYACYMTPLILQLSHTLGGLWESLKKQTFVYY